VFTTVAVGSRADVSEYPAAEFIARCGALRYWHREFAGAG
jgi:hypothetical protein